MTEWISVKDRLPDYNVLVLVYIKSEFYAFDKGCIELDKKVEKGWWLMAENGSQKITHWMPLPEPPKEENE